LRVTSFEFQGAGYGFRGACFRLCATRFGLRAASCAAHLSNPHPRMQFGLWPKWTSSTIQPPTVQRNQHYILSTPLSSQAG